jgi:DNA-binding response OmpR family regulator
LGLTGRHKEVNVRDEVRVVVVDDMHDAAELVASVLSLDGYKTKTAFGGQQALELIEDYRPHVVLLDVDMPGIDGCELAGRLRRSYGDDIVLIAVTGWDDSDQRVSKTFERVDHYFRKPLDHDALRKLLPTVQS